MMQECSDLISRLQAGESASPRDAARLMSLLADDEVAAAQVMEESAADAGRLWGVTGPPGSGKSTLVDALIAALRTRHVARRIGVIAVDPSSHHGGGALLGDRIRMMRHADDPNVFIRSMASRGHLGGLARGARATAAVMQMIGCDPVMLETVGVGQNEIEIVDLAERVVLVLAPGAGDGVQLLKSGLMEIGDILVINKADQAGADVLEQELIMTLHMQHRDVPVASVCALTGTGIDALLEKMEAL